MLCWGITNTLPAIIKVIGYPARGLDFITNSISTVVIKPIGCACVIGAIVHVIGTVVHVVGTVVHVVFRVFHVVGATLHVGYLSKRIAINKRSQQHQ